MSVSRVDGVWSWPSFDDRKWGIKAAIVCHCCVFEVYEMELAIMRGGCDGEYPSALTVTDVVPNFFFFYSALYAFRFPSSEDFECFTSTSLECRGRVERRMDSDVKEVR